MNSEKRTLITLLLSVFLLSVLVVFTAAFYFNKPPPLINGVIIPTGQTLQNFSLIDHKNKIFDNQNLFGNWHILAYGYTDCPDICPTTLAILAQVEKKIIASQQYTDINILFYTVDPQRDTVQKLAQYIPFFSPRFTGLTINNQTSKHIAFEQSLGIQAVLTPLPEGNSDFKGYSVSHGVMLYVLNPNGELQAILKPNTDIQGIQYFNSEEIYQDYRALRKYFAAEI